MNDYFEPTKEDPLGQDKLDDVFNGKYQAKHWGIGLSALNAWLTAAETRYFRRMMDSIFRDNGDGTVTIVPLRDIYR